MSDAKTQISCVAVSDFMAEVEPASKREDALVLDALFRRVTGIEPKMWGPTIIGYGEYRTTYASGRDAHWMRAGFSPRKARHSLYLMGGYCDESAAHKRDVLFEQLGKHARGKSCLYINKLADVNLDILEHMVRQDWETMARIYPL